MGTFSGSLGILSFKLTANVRQANFYDLGFQISNEIRSIKLFWLKEQCYVQNKPKIWIHIQVMVCFPFPLK